jgi:tetratricopeptide (TPR) repeat protein
MEKKNLPAFKISKLILVPILISLLPHFAFAETKTFIKEYTYHAGDEDSRNSSRTIALREVKRLLLEELGTYLESQTEVKNFQMTKDQITALTAGIVSTEVIEDTWDGKTYWLQARIKADSESVIKYIDILRQDRQKVKELEEIKKRSDDLLKENESLRKELTTAKGEKKQKDTVAYNKTIKDIEAGEWYEKGFSLQISGSYKEAVVAYTSAIELNPKYEDAYYNRGLAYYILGNHRQAVSDFDKVIEMRPDSPAYYTGRGLAYYNIDNYGQAIENFDKEIELFPKNGMAYFNRGDTYARLGNYRQAVKDYDKAISLGRPARDLIVEMLGVRSSVPYEMLYNNRGDAHYKLGNYRYAVKDYDKVIELNPKDANAYFNRGIAYQKLGNDNNMKQDMKIAARLGYKEAQDFLKSKGIVW